MKNKIEKIAMHYGAAAQMCKTVEELAELTAEIQRYNLLAFKHQVSMGEVSEQMQKIIEEMADVEIMLEQIKFLFNIDEEVKAMKAFKISRQLDRMARGE